MKLVELLKPWVSTVFADCDIFGIKNDSREVKPGDLFLAYPGALSDGRLFVEQAIQSGAAAIAYDPEKLPSSFKVSASIPCIAIEKLGTKLALIAKQFYQDNHQIPVTGVTGTNGKTTIAYQLAQAYELLGQKAVYIGTLGHGKVNALKHLANTTPDALSLQTFLHQYQEEGIQQVCMEVSSHALCQGRVEMVDITTAIYTNLTLDHLDYHQTMEAYAKAKACLFAFPTLKSAIINHDDDYSKLMAQQVRSDARILTYGLQEGSDVHAIHWKTDMLGSQLEVVSPWGQHELRISLIGAFNIYNSLAVFTCLLAQGYAVNDVINVMKNLRASPGRMEVVSQNPCVIVDYAHTPDALENVLTTLVQLKKGRLGVVFGCGGDRDKTKRPIMGRIASQYADFVVVTSDNPRTEDPDCIIEEVAQGCLSSAQVLKMVSRESAIQHALSIANTDDIILIAGKGHETYQQIGKEKLRFSDQEVAKRFTPTTET